MRLFDADALQYSDARDMLPTGQYITREEIDKAAEPIRHGHWILDKHGNYACEFCGNAPYHSNMHNMNYCPNCGAKLTIERDNITTHLIWNEPTVDAEPIRHGHWEWNDYGGFGNYHCTVCRYIPYGKFSRKFCPDYMYCPRCGAKMDEEREDAEIH